MIVLPRMCSTKKSKTIELRNFCFYPESSKWNNIPAKKCCRNDFNVDTICIAVQTYFINLRQNPGKHLPKGFNLKGKIYLILNMINFSNKGNKKASST
jgi:hypothetical protein